MIKYKASGEVEIFKARLVAKGYSQREGLDSGETFSLMAKMVTMRSVVDVAALKHWFKMKDLGELKFFLGFEFARSNKGILMSQRKEGNATTDEVLRDLSVYQRLVGKLLYLTMTIPDISFVVLVLSQFMHYPKLLIWKQY
ncbi:uncharacterized mitochondrial protein AtMg00810-like [Nicotiana sylvestris]|uniref:uncharacterized mitochondrial protein AtMg00810-like n=1 Tax=Nicotiana sylvestris TaxID=4096 RepID=UPI00388C773B